MSNNGKWLRVHVTDLTTGKSKANVKIPMGMVNFGLKMGAKFAPAEIEGLDLNMVREALENNGTGKIVDVEDSKDGEHVEVFIE